ncbi:MAG: UDP-N-acetylmuramoyl-L-alanine--D-glutamate ligase [Anaerolineaceae bacterium]
MKNYKDSKIIIVGAGRQGIALSQFLAQKGADVTLTDIRTEDQLGDLKTLQDAGVTFAFGGHDPAILDGAQLICLSGGVSPELPFVKAAVTQRIPLSNDSQILLENCPATVIGITGSAGKSTTTSLVGLMANRYNEMKGNRFNVWVGGNIGNPLIGQVDEIGPDDLVVLELSSFQLELMSLSPQIAAVLNLTPNHLDRHPSMEAYRAAKANILIHQKKGDVAVLNRDDEGSWEMHDAVKGDLMTFGFKKPPSHLNGTYVDRGRVCLQSGKDTIKMFPVEWIQLRGKHNLSNVLAAAALAACANLALPAIQLAIDEFAGVPHRLEFVREYKGAKWYNDSIATAPERTQAAIDSFEEPIILLLGGRDKNLPWENLAEQIRQKVSRVVLFGEAADLISDAIGPKKRGQNLQSVVKCDTLQEAIKTAANQVVEGDVVLLSPGGTSFDAFKDFEERGECYRKWVNEL